MQLLVGSPELIKRQIFDVKMAWPMKQWLNLSGLQTTATTTIN